MLEALYVNSNEYNEIRAYFETHIENLRKKGRDGRFHDLKSLLLTSDFYTAPASLTHENKIGGLARHSKNVCEALINLSLDYINKFPISTDSIVIVGLFHDICKIDKFNDLPLGHGEKSLDIISQYLELSPQEKILIRWHNPLVERSYWTHRNELLTKYPEISLIFAADLIACTMEVCKNGI